jgi:photosystem II stability/assembly factor-like uncharacterized protein
LVKTGFLLSSGLFLTSGLLFSTGLYAQNQLELLNETALESQLASKSVLLNMIALNDGYTAVGERGHIIDWKSDGQWSQFDVPVSVTITDVSKLNNGDLVAVGHDAVILLFKQESQEWVKVFDGYSLTDLLIVSLGKQIEAQELRLENLPPDADIYDEEYYLEDLQFALEDAEKEKQAGPNKPLLSVITADNGAVFATGAYGTLLRSIDNGLTWDLVSSRVDNESKFHLNAISKDANGNLFIVGENAVAAKSSDNGESWEPIYLPYSGSFFGIEASPNSDVLVAFGLQGHIAVSNDSGESWVLLPKTLSASFLGGAINENGLAYLVGQGGLIVSFPLSDPENQSIYKHPSGSTFASVMVTSDKELILAGQLGIKRWTIGN